jgi:dihydroneopterin aldolase
MNHWKGLREPSMDIVFIRELRIDTVIGIYDWEREIRQPVVLDLEMGCDIRPAAASERIEDALDYKAVSKRLVSFVEESRFQLVETLAERCAEIVREEFGVAWVRLTLNKIGALSAARDVGVIIERGERS